MKRDTRRDFGGMSTVHQTRSLLRRVVGAMVVSGLFLGSSVASAMHPYPAERDFGGASARVHTAGSETAFPDQSKSNDYGIRVGMTDDDSPFPDQSKTKDYGTRVGMTDDDSPFPDQSKSNDYGIRGIVLLL